MKKIKLIIVFIAFILSSTWTFTHAQLSSNLVLINPIDHELTTFEKSKDKNSILMSDDKCSQYTRMRKVGTGLIVPGAITAGVGLLAIIIGTAINIADEDYDSYEYYFSDSEAYLPIIIGTVAFVAGGVCLGVGIPLRIIGSKKSKQFCNQKTSSLNLIPTQKGVGLQLSF